MVSTIIKGGKEKLERQSRIWVIFNGRYKVVDIHGPLLFGSKGKKNKKADHGGSQINNKDG